MAEEDGRLPMGFPVKKTVDQNIMTKLYRREVAIDNPAQLFHRQRALYQCAVPEFTESNVQTPSCFLRKFTPDGNQLLAFSRDQRSVELYDYLGGGSGQELYCSELDSWSIRSELFGKFFRLRFSIPVAQENEFLNRECSLFTCQSHYLIVGASSVVPDDHYQHTFDLFRNNESVSPSANCQLEDYSLYMVDMKLGIVTDSRSFKLDKIYLSHNQGVSLCNTTLAVLSVQHQTVHLFQVSDGSFLPVQEIGRFCYPDDPLIFSEVQYSQSNATATSDGLHATYNPWLEKWYTSLKHRLLCRLLRQAEEACTPESQAPMAHFYMNHDKFVSLKLWRMQLLDEGHLLLKFATEDVVTMRQSDPTSQPALFGVYDVVTTEFLHIYDNTSESLLRLYELNADHFRTAVSHPYCHQISSVANSGHARALHHKFKQTIMGAKYGGRMEATRRLLGQLPICCQSYSCSPFLDLSLFSYDDKWISALERPKPCEDSSVKFFSRNGGIFAFELHMGASSSSSQGASQSGSTPRKLVAYIFHPYEPFIVSIQRANTDFMVNFHFRNQYGVPHEIDPP
eukprot:Em0009g185a